MSRPGRHSLAAAVFLAAAVAGAQFAESLWPSYEHPRGTFEAQLWQVYSGLVERSDAAGLGRPSPPRVVETNQVVSTNTVPWTTNSVVSTNLYDGLREILIDYKSHTSALIPYFLNMAGADTNGTLSTNALWVNWTTNTFIAALCLPSNYFEVTHFRFLGGLGSLTNDATVGRSHGYTNAWTAAGGTNFPPGRTNWYSTDYGVDGLRLSLKNMRYKLATATMQAQDSRCGDADDNGASTPRSFSYLADIAKKEYTNSAPTTNWVNTTIEWRLFYGWEWTNKSNGQDFRVAIVDSPSAIRCLATNIVTNFSASVDFYVRATNTVIEFDWGVPPAVYVTGTFSSAGTDLEFMQWKRMAGSVTTGQTLTAVSQPLFSFTRFEYPDVCATPSPTSYWPQTYYPGDTNWYYGGEASGFEVRSNTNHLRAVVNFDFAFK